MDIIIRLRRELDKKRGEVKALETAISALGNTPQRAERKNAKPKKRRGTSGYVVGVSKLILGVVMESTHSLTAEDVARLVYGRAGARNTTRAQAALGGLAKSRKIHAFKHQSLKNKLGQPKTMYIGANKNPLSQGDRTARVH